MFDWVLNTPLFLINQTAITKNIEARKDNPAGNCSVRARASTTMRARVNSDKVAQKKKAIKRSPR